MCTYNRGDYKDKSTIQYNEDMKLRLRKQIADAESRGQTVDYTEDVNHINSYWSKYVNEEGPFPVFVGGRERVPCKVLLKVLTEIDERIDQIFINVLNIDESNWSNLYQIKNQLSNLLEMKSSIRAIESDIEEFLLLNDRGNSSIYDTKLLGMLSQMQDTFNNTFNLIKVKENSISASRTTFWSLFISIVALIVSVVAIIIGA